MSRCLIACVLLAPIIALAAADSDVIERDLWMTGTLNEQPLANLHLVSTRHPDGSATTTTSMAMELGRALGNGSMVMAITSTTVSHEDANGNIIGAEYTQEEMGTRTTAVANVVDGVIQAEVTRAGRTTTTAIALPEGARLLSEYGWHTHVGPLAEMAPGTEIRLHTLGLMSGQLRLLASTATMVAHRDDGHHVRVVMDLAPTMPVDTLLRDDGTPVKMRMSLGPMVFDFRPADGPVPLGEAMLAMAGVVNAVGPAPVPFGGNRFRLDPTVLTAIPEDSFQRREGDILVITDSAEPEALADTAAYLQAEPMVEIDDPTLRAWVTTLLTSAPEPVAERAEFLRRAVRAHITNPDLSRGDGSALETFRDRTGDCTEFSYLLTATLRIAGIPARSEVGMVYSAAYGGWGGHAWNSAYDSDNGRWIHLDAAYPGIGRGSYIRTGSTTNPEQGGNNATLDHGMGAILGSTIEVIR